MKISGQQLYIFSGTRENLRPIACSTDCELTLSATTVEGARAGGARKKRAGQKSWGASSRGFLTGIPSPDILGQPITIAITVLQRDLVAAGVNIEHAAPDSVLTLLGRAIPTSVSLAGSKGSMAERTIEYTGSGELGILTTRGGFPYILPLIF